MGKVLPEHSTPMNGGRIFGKRVVGARVGAGARNRIDRKICCVTTKRSSEALLCKRVKAHEAAITAAAVLEDKPGAQKIVTASLDKTMSFWHVEEQPEFATSKVDALRISPNAGPVFSLVPDLDRCKHGTPALYCGTAHKGIICWEPPKQTLVPKVVLDGHTGWIRSLVTNGRWMFSCDCNNLRQWDLSWAIPRHVNDVSLFTGDILGVAVGEGSVFTCGADGSIRSWTVTKSGDLETGPCMENAHDGRITAILWHRNLLYTIGYDGTLKVWQPNTMELLAVVENAHNGSKINCMTIDHEGILYTGGDDNLIRRWNAKNLTPVHAPLCCHQHPVRTLAAGGHCTLVSGDSKGYLSIWKT